MFPEPVSDFTCEVDDTSVNLTWTNGAGDYDSVIVLRDDVLLASVNGDETSYDDLDVDNGSYEYQVQPIRNTLAGELAFCEIVVGVGPEFVRGDVTNNGAVDLADTINALKWQFRDGPPPDCLAAADINADGRVNIADAIRSLAYLFLDGPPPSSPFPDCGVDPEIGLSCDDPRDCE